VDNNQSRAHNARASYLNGLSPDKRAEVMQQAERFGPRPGDPDWLVAATCAEVVAQLQGMAGRVETAAAPSATIDDIRAVVTDACTTAAKKTLPTPVHCDQATRLDHLDARMDERLRKIEAIVRLGVSSNQPSNHIFRRDLLTVLLTVLAMTALAIVTARFAPPMTLIAAFGLGIAVTLGYLWAAPLVLLAILRR
jgi:hypothetical protein